MSKRTYPYPEDEFDAPAGDETPAAAHRARRSPARKFVAPVLVLVVAAGLGYALALSLPTVFGLSATDLASVAGISDDTSSQESATTTEGSTATDESTTTDPSATDSPSETVSGSPSDSETTEDTDSPSPSATPDSADVDKATAVRVLNATNSSGLAAKGAALLRDEGWSDLTQDNYRGSAVSSSVVYYRTAQDKAAAQAVADILGISRVTRVASLVGPVSAVLSSDFSG